MFRRAPQIAFRVHGDEAVLVVTRKDRMHRLNRTGTWLWQRLAERTKRDPDGGCSVEQLVPDFTQTFEVEPAQASADISAFFADLEQAGALRRVPS